MAPRVRPGDELVVARLDDLAPSLEELSALLRRAAARGVRLRFADDRVAASAAEAEVLVKGILLAADFQARLTAARLRDQVVRARQDGGLRTGRPRKLDAERVARRRADGLGPTAIARELGVARASVHRKLKEIETPQMRRLVRPPS